MKQRNLQTIIAPEETSSPVGTQPGATGSERRESSATATLQPRPARMGHATWVEVAHRLAAKTPAEVAATLRSQASSRNVELRLASDSSAAGLTAVGDPAALAEMRAVAEKAITPPPAFLVEEWIAEVDAITVSASADEMTTTLKIEALTRRLTQFPADLVKAAILGWPGKFFPTFAELSARMAPDFADRMRIVNALRAATAPPAENAADRRAQRRLTPEEAQAIIDEAGLGRAVPRMPPPGHPPAAEN